MDQDWDRDFDSCTEHRGITGYRGRLRRNSRARLDRQRTVDLLDKGFAYVNRTFPQTVPSELEYREALSHAPGTSP